MLPFSYSTSRPIKNLPKLLKAYRAHGGSIVQYQRVVSCVFISQMSSHYVWVPPNGSPVSRSLPDTLITLLFGWWSFFGFIWTFGALATNLGGGVDATEELLDATRGGNVALAQQALDVDRKERRQQSIRALLQFGAVVAGIVLVFWSIARISDLCITKGEASRAAATKQAPLTVRARTANETKPTSAQQPGRSPRLQAIFYSGNGHSTAIINGKTLSVGDTVAGHKVSLIEPHSVMLRSPEGRTVVLNPAGER